MDEEYAREYSRLARAHWWSRARNTYVLRRLEQMATESGFGRILDVGCGDGCNLSGLARFGEVEGLEPDAATLGAGTLSRWTIHQQRFDLSFRPQKTYGLITMLDVLEHIEDEDQALSTARQHLDASGFLVLTVPAFSFLWTSHDDVNQHCRRYHRRTLTAAFERNGWEILDMRYLFHSLVAAKLAVVLKEAVFGPRPGIPSIPPSLVNRTLEVVCRLEQTLVSPMPIPFGTSLFAIARPAR